MIHSRFKSENLVIMQILTASSFWPEIVNLSVHCTLYRDSMHHILCYESQTTFSLLLCFLVFFSNFIYILGGSRYVPSELYSMERRNTCLTIRKLLVLAPS